MPQDSDAAVSATYLRVTVDV